MCSAAKMALEEEVDVEVEVKRERRGEGHCSFRTRTLHHTFVMKF